jgi:hypothetical protein
LPTSSSKGGGGAASKLRLEDAEVGGIGKHGIFVQRNSSVEPCSNVTFDNNEGSNTRGAGTVTCN